jgi:hypothetical protein
MRLINLFFGLTLPSQQTNGGAQQLLIVGQSLIGQTEPMHVHPRYGEVWHPHLAAYLMHRRKSCLVTNEHPNARNPTTRLPCSDHLQLMAVAFVILL